MKRTNDFQSIRSEGGLLSPDLLRRVLDPREKLPGTLPEEYGLPKGERLNEVITQSWNRLQKHWAVFPLLSEYSLSLEFILLDEALGVGLVEVSEACETQVWAEFARRCGYLSPEICDELDATYDQIMGQIVKMIDDPDKWLIR
jgi:hypothetical protein